MEQIALSDTLNDSGTHLDDDHGEAGRGASFATFPSPFAENEWAKAIEAQVAIARAEARIANDKLAELSEWVSHARTVSSLEKGFVAVASKQPPHEPAADQQEAAGAMLGTPSSVVDALCAMKQRMKAEIIEFVGEYLSKATETLGADVADVLSLVVANHREVAQSFVEVQRGLKDTRGRVKQVKASCAQLAEVVAQAQTRVDAALSERLLPLAASKPSNSGARPFAVLLQQQTDRGMRKQWFSKWIQLAAAARCRRLVVRQFEHAQQQASKVLLRRGFERWRTWKEDRERARQAIRLSGKSALFALTRNASTRLCWRYWRAWMLARGARKEREARLDGCRRLVIRCMGDAQRRFFWSWRASAAHKKHVREVTAANAAAERQSANQRLRAIGALAMAGDAGLRKCSFCTWVRFAAARKQARIRNALCDMSRRRCIAMCRRQFFRRWVTWAYSRRISRVQSALQDTQQNIGDVLQLLRRERKRSTAYQSSEMCRHATLRVLGRFFTPWISRAQNRLRERRLRSAAVLLSTATDAGLRRRYFGDWMRSALRRRAKLRIAAAAVVTIGLRSAAVRQRFTFQLWRRFASETRKAQARHFTNMKNCVFRNWRARQQIAARARAAGLLADTKSSARSMRCDALRKRGDIQVLEARSARAQMTRAFRKWMLHHVLETRMALKAAALQHALEMRRAHSIFSRWRRSVPQESWLKPDAIEGLSSAVDALERLHLQSAAQLQNISRRLESNPDQDAIAARMRLFSSELAKCGLLPSLGVCKSGVAAIRSLAEVRDSTFLGVERNCTVPIGPNLSTQSRSKYCECCFDKNCSGSHDAAPEGLSRRAQDLCRKRFQVSLEMMTLLAQWMATLDAHQLRQRS